MSWTDCSTSQYQNYLNTRGNLYRRAVFSTYATLKINDMNMLNNTYILERYIYLCVFFLSLISN